jgi:hypothetical protein
VPPSRRSSAEEPVRRVRSVAFRYRKRGLGAISLNYQSPTVVDARLGRVLRMQPPELQRRIAAWYGNRYELGVGYGSELGRGCIGIFQTAAARRSRSASIPTTARG